MVTYADPKNKKYPIDTEAHVRAAWAYINVQKNADEYPMNSVTLKSVKDKIKAAAKKLGIKINESADALDIARAVVEMQDEARAYAPNLPPSAEHRLHEAVVFGSNLYESADQEIRYLHDLGLL